MTKAERTRQFIIEQAAPIFNRKGVAGTSISDIMEATKLAKGGIYGNFATKEEISVEVFDYMMEKVMEELRVVAASEISSGGKLYALLDFHRNYAVKPTMIGGCPLLNFGIEADDTNPLIKRRVNEVILAMEDSIVALVERGIRYGEFRKDWDARSFAIRMFAMLEGGILISRIQNNNRQMCVIVDALKAEVAANIVAGEKGVVGGRKGGKEGERK